MNILLLTSHDIAEWDDLRMLTDLGADVFSIGAFTNPSKPGGSTVRPPLDLPAHPDLEARCVEQREKHAGEPMQAFIEGQVHNIVDWAKADLHDDIIDWADVIICHHYLESWIVRQWPRLRHKRVIWRTCGQSNAYLEETMTKLHADGLQIIRYSPKEEQAFTRLGTWAGMDALIRFGKYPSDYGPWIGDDRHVGNVTQNMAGRGEFCGYNFWLDATRDLPVKPAGLESDVWNDGGVMKMGVPGAIGALSYADMIEYLKHIRCYLYTGTQPASYTLALMEAMLSGVPVVSMPAEDWWIPDLFEGPDIANVPPLRPARDARVAGVLLRQLLHDDDYAAEVSAATLARALDLFDIAKVGPQWAAFLGLKVEVAA